jgi:hypothetical protein
MGNVPQLITAVPWGLGRPRLLVDGIRLTFEYPERFGLELLQDLSVLGDGVAQRDGDLRCRLLGVFCKKIDPDLKQRSSRHLLGDDRKGVYIDDRSGFSDRHGRSIAAFRAHGQRRL